MAEMQVNNESNGKENDLSPLETALRYSLSMVKQINLVV